MTELGASEPSQLPLTVLCLPPDVMLGNVFFHLEARDLAACMCTSRAWRQAAGTAAGEHWERLATQRWCHSQPGTWDHLESDWAQLYRERAQVG